MTLFRDHRRAAMALLNNAELKPREGQFCGGIAFDPQPLTPRQRNWLDVLLDRHGLSPMEREVQP